MKKKRYNITLMEPATEKVQKVLKKANLSLSAFLDVMVCHFSEIIDDTEMESKMENMTMSQCLGMLSGIVGKIEEIKDEELEKKIESMKMESKLGRPRKNVAKKET